MAAFEIDHNSTLSPGTEVEVLTRYRRTWATGFEVASIDNDRYRLRRRSDGTVLPAPFAPSDIRPRGRRA